MRGSQSAQVIPQASAMKAMSGRNDGGTAGAAMLSPSVCGEYVA